MRALTRPNPEHNYNTTTEINRLRTHRDAAHADPKDSRHIPAVGHAGNYERAANIFDTRRIQVGPKIGEVVIVEWKESTSSYPASSPGR